MIRLAFADSSAVIEVPEKAEILAALRAAAPGWPFAPSTATTRPLARLLERDGLFVFEADGEEPVVLSAVAAACSLLVDVVGGYMADNPERLCLHCGAAVFNDRLFIFPSRSHAGKSTLIARLAASGHQIFSDDILPLSEDDRRGISLGIAPRLRVPLPSGATQAFKEFVDRHTSLADGRYLYLALPDGGLAPRGSTCPLGGIILLDRQEQARASLSEAADSAVLESLIVQNFARAGPADALLRRLHGLMKQLPRLLLRYSDLEEAATLLGETLRTWPPSVQDPPHSDPYPDLVTGNGEDRRDRVEAGVGVDVGGDEMLWQNPDCSAQTVDGEVFLANADGTSIHRLNAVGSGIWNLMASGISQREATQIVSTAFPNVDQDTITWDVAQIFLQLWTSGFAVGFGQIQQQGAQDRAAACQ